MKTTDPRDPLDQKINELLASQPLKAPGDFSTRILDELDSQQDIKSSGRLAPLIRFALPLAAALAIALVLFNSFSDNNSAGSVQIADNNPNKAAPVETTGPDTNDALSSLEIQEILLLQEGLSGFAQVESDDLNGSELLNTLDTLYSI